MNKFPSLQLFSRRWAQSWLLASATFLAALLAGCREPDAVSVKLQAHPVSKESSRRLSIQAQVEGVQEGLRYKWFSFGGSCDPQESDSPSTIFKFGEDVFRDRVSVEVWRESHRVAQGEINVKFDATTLVAEREHPPEVNIEITTIPPREQGGPDTHSAIAGKVSGKVSTNYNVIVYARAYESWYVQPTTRAQHPVHEDHTWATWTHTGTSYAALLVRPDFEPLVRLDMLPPVGGDVLARTIVDGTRK